jgi:hypothetical protein
MKNAVTGTPVRLSILGADPEPLGSDRYARVMDRLSREQRLMRTAVASPASPQHDERRRSSGDIPRGTSA